LPKRIMVVDDDPTIVKILTKRLLAHGYVVMSANGGPDLLTKLSTFRPDGILLDVMMPGMDGVQVAERLGRTYSTSRIPIVFVSALIGPDHPQDSPTNPLHHYLGKPFEPEILIRLLQRIGL